MNILDYSGAVTLDAWTFTQRSHQALIAQQIDQEGRSSGDAQAAVQRDDQ
ncbi:hypothetical protein [Streptomyces sp. MAA16]|nr:hypothetical protein [Streptomyces sp. MAA16]MDH6699988.1 hypothetical protein [Streptomyces sp. MAA16]